MRLGHFQKTPAERKRYAVDYVNWLDTGETLAAYQFTITPANAVAVTSPTISSGTKLVFFVEGGASGKQYSVDIRVTTSGNQIKEDTILYTVRDAV